MRNLAATLCSLDREQEALVVAEQLLEFRLRVLPENHPQIGEWVYELLRCGFDSQPFS